MKKVTEADIIEALFKRFDPSAGQWACFDHLRMGTGYGGHSERTIDFFALHCEPHKKFLSVAVEIKVSRSDFLKEIANPEKRLAASVLATHFIFAFPKGMLQPNEIPRDCGSMEYEDGQIIRATEYFGTKNGLGDLVNPSWRFLASLLRRQSKDEWNRRAELKLAAAGC